MRARMRVRLGLSYILTKEPLGIGTMRKPLGGSSSALAAAAGKATSAEREPSRQTARASQGGLVTGRPGDRCSVRDG